MCNDPRCRLPGFIPCPPEDVELTVLLGKVVALKAEAMAAKEAADRIWPEVERLAKGDALWRSSRNQRSKAAEQYARSSGWEALVALENRKLEEADELAKRMWNIAATSAVGRQAKLTVFYALIAHGDWLQPIEDAEWEIRTARRLLEEFAGGS